MPYYHGHPQDRELLWVFFDIIIFLDALVYFVNDCIYFAELLILSDNSRGKFVPEESVELHDTFVSLVLNLYGYQLIDKLTVLHKQVADSLQHMKQQNWGFLARDLLMQVFFQLFELTWGMIRLSQLEPSQMVELLE